MRDSVSYLDNLLHYIINTYFLALVFTYFIVGRLRALISTYKRIFHSLFLQLEDRQKL